MGDTQREATSGGSAALSLRIASNVVLGGEVWYLRHYDAANLTAFTGDAVMLGPTLYIQFTPKMFMTAAWNAQVWGREVGNPVAAQSVGISAQSRQAQIRLGILISSTPERIDKCLL